MLKVVYLTLFFTLSFPVFGWSSDNDELLEQVRLAHKAARQSIQQFSCTYRVSRTLPANVVMAYGQYARAGDVISIRVGEEGTALQNIVFRAGSWKSVGRAWKNLKIEYATAIQSDTQFFSLGDVWDRMMIDQADWEGGRCNFDRVLDRIAKNARLRKVRIMGRDYVLIEVEEKTKQGATKNLKIWHDIGYNYLIRKCEHYDLKHPKDQTIFEVAEFKDPVPGVFIPVKSRLDSLQNGEVASSMETVLTDIVVNQPIPDSTFILPAIPSGTRQEDYIRGTKGQAGSDWKSVGATTPMIRATVPTSSDVLAGRPTAAEPWTLNQYLLYGSLVVFVLCMIFLLLRRRLASVAG